jgi:hypothetical protein
MILLILSAAPHLCAGRGNNQSPLNSTVCDYGASKHPGYASYFKGMNKLYQRIEKETCLPAHRECGWPHSSKKLPQFVLIIGLEGSAHHFWTKLLYSPVFDCVWVNSRHYRRDVGDGVPRRTPKELRSGILEQMDIREREAPPRCRFLAMVGAMSDLSQEDIGQRRLISNGCD